MNLLALTRLWKFITKIEFGVYDETALKWRFHAYGKLIVAYEEISLPCIRKEIAFSYLTWHNYLKTIYFKTLCSCEQTVQEVDHELLKY